MNIQTFLINILTFLNDVIIPFFIALAFLVFLWNIARFFIFQGGDEKKHSEARSYAMWSIAAFVFILSIWGIVNLLVGSFAFGPNKTIVPDYMSTKKVRFNDIQTSQTQTTGEAYYDP